MADSSTSMDGFEVVSVPGGTDARKALHAALVQFQAACPPIPKTRTAVIPGKDGKAGYKYQYADLADINDAIRKPLGDAGLSWTQDVRTESGFVHVYTTVRHADGGSFTTGPFVLPAGGTPQTAGSATSYGRRYSLSAALGIVTEEDDDAATATHSADATTANGTIPMSDKQGKLIRVLAAERKLDNATLHKMAGAMLGTPVTTLTVLTGGRDGTASQFIELVKDTPIPGQDDSMPDTDGPEIPF